jgi:hypothetical protein
MKAMAREIAERYASMDKLAEALTDFGRKPDSAARLASPLLKPLPSGSAPQQPGWYTTLARLFGSWVRHKDRPPAAPS